MNLLVISNDSKKYSSKNFSLLLHINVTGEVDEFVDLAGIPINQVMNGPDSDQWQFTPSLKKL